MKLGATKVEVKIWVKLESGGVRLVDFLARNQDFSRDFHNNFISCHIYHIDPYYFSTSDIRTIDFSLFEVFVINGSHEVWNFALGSQYKNFVMASEDERYTRADEFG